MAKPVEIEAPSRRQAAGAAVLQSNVTEALMAAAVAELNAVGYARLTIDAVAKRAQVGKPAVYRRWRSKAELVTALVHAASIRAFPPIDTGELHSDLLANLHHTRALMTDPATSLIFPDLIAEMARSPDLAQAWGEVIVTGRRGIGREMLERAQARGELGDIDIELALDLMISPLFWRIHVLQAQADDAYLRELADRQALVFGARLA